MTVICGESFETTFYSAKWIDFVNLLLTVIVMSMRKGLFHHDNHDESRGTLDQNLKDIGTRQFYVNVRGTSDFRHVQLVDTFQPSLD